MDLRSWNILEQPIIPLDGEWEFSSDILVFQSTRSSSSETISNSSSLWAPISVPGAWNSRQLETPGGEDSSQTSFFPEPKPGLGIGTYRLTILMPDGHSEPYGLKINDTSTAFQLFINGELIHENGKIGLSRLDMVPSYKHPIIILPQDPKRSEIYLEMKFSNFYHNTGGIRKSIELGAAHDIFAVKSEEVSLGWFAFGSTFIMALYHLAIFFMRTKEKSSLWFALFCLDVSFRSFFTGSVFAYEIAPDSLWVWIHRLDLITFILAMPFFSFFIHSVFPLEFRKTYIYLNLVFSAFFGLLVLLSESQVYMKYMIFFQILVGIGILYSSYAIVSALAKKREGSVLFSIGSGILFLTVINDILNQLLIINTAYLANWGMLGFLFVQATMLSVRFTSAFGKLEDLQKSLEEKVESRTKDLDLARRQAEKANDLKDQFLSLVSHDLRSPISTVIGLLSLLENARDKLTEAEVSEYLRSAQNISRDSLHMISNLLENVRIQSGEIQVFPKPLHAAYLVDSIIEKFRPNLESKSIFVQNETNPEDTLIADKVLLKEVLVNLLSNAIKFSNSHSKIKIYTERSENLFRFFVQDEGVGMNPEKLASLYSRKTNKTNLGTAGEVGTGLGIPLIHEIIEAWKGELIVQSNPGSGTVFQFSIPQPKSLPKATTHFNQDQESPDLGPAIS